MSLEDVRQKVVDLKHECDTWPLVSFKNIMDAQSEAYQQVLDIIDEELEKEGTDGRQDRR